MQKAIDSNKLSKHHQTLREKFVYHSQQLKDFFNALYSKELGNLTQYAPLSSPNHALPTTSNVLIPKKSMGRKKGIQTIKVESLWNLQTKSNSSIKKKNINLQKYFANHISHKIRGKKKSELYPLKRNFLPNLESRQFQSNERSNNFSKNHKGNYAFASRKNIFKKTSNLASEGFLAIDDGRQMTKHKSQNKEIKKYRKNMNPSLENHTGNYQTDHFFQLDIVGDGAEMRKLQDLTERLEISQYVYFHGYQQNIMPILNHADIAVMPMRWQEPFGLSGVEAMSQKKAIVAFDVGGISEWLIDGKTGIFAKQNTPIGLASALLPLLTNDKMRKQLGHNAREHAKRNFSSAEFLKKFEGIISEKN